MKIVVYATPTSSLQILQKMVAEDGGSAMNKLDIWYTTKTTQKRFEAQGFSLQTSISSVYIFKVIWL